MFALPPFHFPTPELAALDHDLQARFATVPTHQFGIERVSENQHDLYVPGTKAEKQTISRLRARHTQAAFYLMSRDLWLRVWDGALYKPIQGPICLTGKDLRAPLPRAVNFGPEIGLPQAASSGPGGILAQSSRLETHLPGGTPVPSPTPPPGAPRPNDLQSLGNEIFESAEDAARRVPVGAFRKAVPGGWSVVAVPIRASQAACLQCHGHARLSGISDKVSKARLNRRLEVGDALGVAFYIFKQTETSPPLQRARSRRQ